MQAKTAPETVSVQFEFKSAALRSELEQLCQRVAAHFDKSPAQRLFCYVDDCVPESVTQDHGNFTGIHTPIVGGGKWPHYVEAHLYTYECLPAFDNLIYIMGTKYVHDPIAFVLTLAHEFQHFAQYCQSEVTYRASATLLENIRSVSPDSKAWDFPHERDAIIVSVKVTVAEFGSGEFRRLVQHQLHDASAEQNAGKKELWMLTDQLASAPAFNWIDEAKDAVAKYLPLLKSHLNQRQISTLQACLD